MIDNFKDSVSNYNCTFKAIVQVCSKFFFMLTRRHIRIKVFQNLYALSKSPENTLERQQKLLKESIDQSISLYLLQLNFFFALRQWATRDLKARKNAYLESTKSVYADPERFIHNPYLMAITETDALRTHWKKHKINQWYLNEKYVVKVYNEYVASALYVNYMTAEKVSLKQHQEQLLSLFHDFVAPNDELYGFLEDECLSWADDFPVINTFIYKKLSTLSLTENTAFDTIDELVSDDDRKFATALLAKIALNYKAYAKEIEGKTPNWDQDRITDVDKILLIMGIGELLDFESIPPKVTLNEYLEIAKEYSTPKSSLFINGILDQLSKEFNENKRIIKAGRGLL